MKSYMSKIGLLLMALLALPVWLNAQETPTAAEDVPTATTAESTGARSFFSLALGPAYGAFDVDGNERRARQYVSPPEGWYLGELTLRYRRPDGSSLFDLGVENLGTQAVHGDLWWAESNSAMVVRAETQRSRFFREWLLPGPALQRRNSGADAIFNLPAGGELQFAFHDMLLEGGSEPEDWLRDVARVNYTLADKSFANNGSRIKGGYSTEEFTFLTGPYFDGTTRTLQGSISPRTSENTYLEASAALIDTSIETVPDAPREFNVALEGSHAVNDALTFSGQLSHDEYTRNLTENAFAARDSAAEVQAQYRGITRVVLTAGGQLRLVDYVNTPQTDSTLAQQHVYFLKGRARLTDKVKLQASHRRLWTDDRPLVTDDNDNVSPFSLNWSDKADSRVELSYAPAWNMGLTGRWRRVQWENTDLATQNALHERDLYGWWMPNDRATLYANYLRQDFTLDGVELVGQRYTTDSEVIVYGVSYQVTPGFSADLSVTDSDSRGAFDANQRIFTLGLNYDMKNGDRMSLRLSSDDFRTAEDLPNLDYDGDRVELQYIKRVF